MVFFFVRASVQLFVLRLLPSYKKWQQNSVYLAFAINFLVTLYACITFGVSCRPFRASWEDVPNSKCFSTNLLVITNRVNAGKLSTTSSNILSSYGRSFGLALSCLCDGATAVIPIFLLWNVKMRATTKRQLNVLFGLSLVTGALSIGRAALVTRKVLTEDATCTFQQPTNFLVRKLISEQGTRSGHTTSVCSKSSSVSSSHVAPPYDSSGPTGKERNRGYQPRNDNTRMKTLRRCAIASTFVIYSGIEKLPWLAIEFTKPHASSETNRHRQTLPAVIHKARRKSKIPCSISGRNGSRM